MHVETLVTKQRPMELPSFGPHHVPFTPTLIKYNFIMGKQSVWVQIH